MKRRLLITSSALVLLSACGGGGDDAPSTPATATFNLRQAYVAMIAASAATTYDVSSSCGGTASETISAPVAGTFEGAPALVKTTTSTLNLTGCTGSGTTTSQVFYDSAHTPLGMATPGTSYSKFQAPVIVPETVRVNDTAILGTQTVWTSSTKASARGTLVYSFVVESDTPTSVIIKLIAKSFTQTTALQFTETDVYRLSGTTLTNRGKTVLFANGTNLVLTPR